MLDHTIPTLVFVVKCNVTNLITRHQLISVPIKGPNCNPDIRNLVFIVKYNVTNLDDRDKLVSECNYKC